jgi:membrane-bound metal-dependent hydrolase YbcI (DUF457 family)
MPEHVRCGYPERMKRTTHLMMGAAAGLLVAAPASVPVMAGAAWMGAVGGGFPDWLDLRSELRGSLRLRHRGASHGLPFVAAMTALVAVAMWALASGDAGLPDWMAIEAGTARLWTLAFLLGLLTHLAGDACTHAGIRPLLPFVRWRLWLLPGFLRGRSDGWLNGVAMLLSAGTIGLIVVWRVALASGSI